MINTGCGNSGSTLHSSVCLSNDRTLQEITDRSTGPYPLVDTSYTKCHHLSPLSGSCVQNCRSVLVVL